MNKLNVLTNNSLENNDIIFFTSGEEIIKLAADGSFYVKGKKVIEDIEVYNGFVTFLKGVGCYKNDKL
jgi:hypothetical protein